MTVYERLQLHSCSNFYYYYLFAVDNQTKYSCLIISIHYHKQNTVRIHLSMQKFLLSHVHWCFQFNAALLEQLQNSTILRPEIPFMGAAATEKGNCGTMAILILGVWELVPLDLSGQSDFDHKGLVIPNSMLKYPRSGLLQVSQYQGYS